jgi:hypothetical protein
MGAVLRDDGFLVALVVAAIGAAVAWWCAARTGVTVPVPAVTVVAALAGLRADHHLSFSLVLGLALLALAAWSSRAGAGVVTAGIAVLAGAVILVSAYPDGLDTWVSAVVLLALVPLVPLVELRARRWGSPAPAVLFLAALGVYACVPDTEFVLPLLAATLATAFLAPLPERAVTQLGTGVVAALLVWTTGIEGFARPGSVIGAIACVAALAFFPALPEHRPLPRSYWVSVGVTALLVLWCSRVAGFVDSAWLAAFLAIVGFAVALVVTVVVSGTTHLRRR